MAIHKKALVDAFKPHFKEHGFTKKGATWNLLAPEAIHVFNIQTSQWSESYYFNAGIYFRALGPLITPAEPHCHIRTRIPDHKLHSDFHQMAVKLSDFERPDFHADEDIVKLKNLIVLLVFDWFARFGNVVSAKGQLTGVKSSCFIRKEVWPFLGLEIPT